MKLRIPFSRTIKCIIERALRERQYQSCGWVFSSTRMHMLIYDVDEWEKYYLPIAVKGKTVLDVGAGEGETARFFLERGAAQVICIEPDKEAFQLLQFNAQNRRMVCFNRPFRLTDLKCFHFDLAKIDIEGYEEALLKLKRPLQKPYAIEVHGMQLIEKFTKKGYKIANPNGCPWVGYAVSPR